MALSTWQQERLDAFLKTIDVHKYQVATAETYSYGSWKILDMNDQECFFRGGEVIATKDPLTTEYTINVDAVDVTSAIAGSLESIVGWGIDTYSDHLQYSFYVRSRRDIVGAHKRRIPIRKGMVLLKHDDEWQDKADIFPDIPHDEECTKGTHNFVVWFAFQGKSWTECRKCGFNLYRKNPQADWIRLHHQGWRMRNDLRDGKHHQSFRDRLPNSEIHYNHEHNTFIKLTGKTDYWGKLAIRSVREDDVKEYESYGVFDQPALDNEPSYADFQKLAKEMRP